MSHDQLFKELLREFFADFLRLFFPDVAARLDFSRLTFLDKEFFTDFPEGSQRDADVLAEVYAQEGETAEAELILVHIEVEGKRGKRFAQRMWEYFAVLWLRYRRRVLPIVIYLSPGSGGITVETFELSLLGRRLITFEYNVVGLPDLNADDYRRLGEPLAMALGAVMHPGQAGALSQKWEALLAIAGSGLNDARKALLANIVESYLELNPIEQEAFEQRLAQESEKVRAMISVYEERGLARGIQQGIEQGIERGRRETLRELLTVKFGLLPLDIENRLNQLSSEELDKTLRRIFSVQSLDDLELSGNTDTD